jgi:hypothetical protein
MSVSITRWRFAPEGELVVEGDAVGCPVDLTGVGVMGAGVIVGVGDNVAIGAAVGVDTGTADGDGFVVPLQATTPTARKAMIEVGLRMNAIMRHSHRTNLPTVVVAQRDR